jgi:hypothetical protein
VISGDDLVVQQTPDGGATSAVSPTQLQVTGVQHTSDKPPTEASAAWQGSGGPVRTSFSEHIITGPQLSIFGAVFVPFFNDIRYGD